MKLKKYKEEIEHLKDENFELIQVSNTNSTETIVGSHILRLLPSVELY
jgi:hypothetical protein